MVDFIVALARQRQIFCRIQIPIQEPPDQTA
jgi:hypothetical protein